MAIEFLCPNGHKIRCQVEQAGRPAKCPRCGATFRIPDAAELEASAASESSVLSEPKAIGVSSSVKRSTQSAGSAKEPQMEFLCPNGHRLFGAANLAGRPGECPDCGARFRIPTFEETFAEAKSESTIQLVAPNPQSESTIGPLPYFPTEPSPSSSGNNSRAKTAAAVEDDIMPATIWSVADGSALVEQPLATLFARLWTSRPKSSRVEIQFHDGETVVVEKFMVALSQQTHGVFGIRAPEGTFSMLAVAWASIERVLVQGLKELPK